MNIFSSLAKLIPSKDDAEAELSPEEQAAQDKADRIAFHRTQVRNGPVSFKYQSAGQQRRAAARAQKSAIRKNFKREVKQYHDRQRVAAILRPHLQVLGLVPTASGRTFTEHEEIVSTAWIVQRYGTDLGDGTVSFLLADVITALQTAAKFYESATGYVITFPADFAVHAEVAVA